MISLEFINKYSYMDIFFLFCRMKKMATEEVCYKSFTFSLNVFLFFK